MTSQTYPQFYKILSLVLSQNPLQKRRIMDFVENQDSYYWCFAEQLSELLNGNFLNDEEKKEEIIRSYNKTCMEILREQIQFKKTGKYSAYDLQSVKQHVYGDKKKMGDYIIGLLFSYLFWPNHYRIFRFFQESIKYIRVTKYLEVGAGHGLFAAEVLKMFSDAESTLIDISETSLKITEEMLVAYKIDLSKTILINNDFLNIDESQKEYDFIVMGEVLEHVENASEFLVKARNLLHPDGKIFVSTCANCPAVDHIYHFHSAREIRQHIEDAGLSVLRECIIPLENIPEDKWEKEKVSVNYAALVEAL